MADIVGTVGSIVGIVDVGLKLAMTLHTYVEAVAEAKEQLGEVASDVDATAGALKQLHTILESDKAAVEASKNSSSSSSTKGNYPTPASTRVVLKEAEHQNIETLAVRCEKVYVAITVLVNKAAGLQAGDGVPGHNALAIAGLSLRRRLKWPWLRPRIARCQETLQGLKITLMLHLSIANLAQLQIAHQSRVPDTLEDERNLRDIAELLKNKQVEYNKKADFTAVAGAPAPNIASNDSIPRQARQVSLEASQHFRHLFMHKDRQSRPTIAPVEGHRLSSVLIPTQLDNLPPLAAKAIHFETSAWAADFAAGDTQDPTPVNIAEYAAGVQDSPATTEAVAEVDSRITSSRVPAKSDQEPRARSDIEDNLGPDTTTNAVDDNDGDVGMYAQIDMMEDVRNGDEILEAYIIDPDTTASRRLEFSIEQLYHSLKRTQKLVPQSLVERFMAISPERRRHIQKCLARANFDLSPYHGICLDIFVQPPSAHGAADDGIVVFLKRRKTGFNLVRLSDSSTMRKFDVPFENCRTWESMRNIISKTVAQPDHSAAEALRAGRYDLYVATHNDTSHILLPESWTATVRPGMGIAIVPWHQETPKITEDLMPRRFNTLMGRMLNPLRGRMRMWKESYGNEARTPGPRFGFRRRQRCSNSSVSSSDESSGDYGHDAEVDMARTPRPWFSFRRCQRYSDSSSSSSDESSGAEVDDERRGAGAYHFRGEPSMAQISLDDHDAEAAKEVEALLGTHGFEGELSTAQLSLDELLSKWTNAPKTANITQFLN